MRRSGSAGFTLMELIIVMALLSGVMILGASTMLGFAQRFSSDIQLDRAEKSANRVMTEFSAAMKSAISYAIYDNAVTWQGAPATTQGNFLLITKADGGQIGFAFVAGEIQIINDPAGSRQTLVCNQSALTPSDVFAFMEDGIPTLAWSVNLPAEQVQFRSCAQPLYMQ